MKKILLLALLLSGRMAALYAQNTCANRCLNFDGKDDYVQLAKSPVQGNVDFTVEGWFRSLDSDGLSNCPSGNFERIIGCGGSRLEIGECAGTFALFMGPSGFLSSGVKTGDAKWHHFALTKAGGAFRVYLDQALVISYDLPANKTFSLDNIFRIGRWAGGGTSPEHWQGDIDEVRVWDSALSEEVLWSQLDCKLNGKKPGLLAYYNFDQGTPGGNNTKVKNVLTDLTASANTGTLYGFAFTGVGSNWICSGTPHAAFCDDPFKNTPVIVTPANNATYKLGGAKLPDFTWTWNGAAPPPTAYYVEVFSLDSNTSKAVFSKMVDGTSLPAAAVFGDKPKAGIYQWQVTNPATGRQSAPAYFTLFDAACGTISATIATICKDWTPGGLPIYTVTLTLKNTPTVGTLGCPAVYNTFVPTQGSISGSISPALAATILPNATVTFTFNYIPASISQATIQVVCNGVWQDAFNNTVILQVNGELKPCFCNDCKEFSATNLIVTPVANNPGMFNLAGSLPTAGMPGPISAVEFQVKTFSFSATPTACSNGVTSVESSGVFLNPASSINNSTALIFFNETISPPVPPTNNNASKDIKWIGGPLPVGPPIPFNLSIGVPRPLQGINADCCKMRYRVCVKATIFYGENGCRVCTTIFCKDFTN